jgi:hypothetical protein
MSYYPRVVPDPYEKLRDDTRKNEPEEESARRPVGVTPMASFPPISTFPRAVLERLEKMRSEARTEGQEEEPARKPERKAPMSLYPRAVLERLEKLRGETHNNKPAEGPAQERVRKAPMSYYPRVVPDPYEQLGGEVYEEEDEERTPGLLQVCWPAVFGIMLAMIAPQLHSYVADRWGDLGERLVFPFMLLAGRPELGLSDELQKSLPELLEWMAFPILGLYVSLSLRKKVRFGMAMAQILFANLIAAFVLWLLSKPGASHGL